MYSPNNVKFMFYRKDCTPMQLLRLMNRWQIHRQELERVLISLPRVCRFVIIKQDTYVIQVRGSTERRVTKVQLKGLFGKTLNIDMKIAVKIAVVTQLEIYKEVNLSSIPSKFYIQHSLVLLLCGAIYNHKRQACWL